MPGVSVYPHLCATSETHWLWISMQHFWFPTLIENIARNYYYGILTGSWFCYHLAQACQFIFSLSLVFPLVRLFLSCGASRREKGRAVSFLLFKIQQARYCWELPLFSCSCLFSFHLSRSSLVEDGEKTATYTPFFDTPSRPRCCYVPRAELSPSGNLSLHMWVHILDFCFELSWREALCASISWSNKKFPVVTSWLLTVCPLGWQRESEANIGRRSCHTLISALMRRIKRCPYLNVLLKGKTEGRVCMCVCVIC